MGIWDNSTVTKCHLGDQLAQKTSSCEEMNLCCSGVEVMMLHIHKNIYKIYSILLV